MAHLLLEPGTADPIVSGGAGRTPSPIMGTSSRSARSVFVAAVTVLIRRG
jgi:hypothetical protein